MITRWAARNGYTRVRAGERVLVNVPLELEDGNYVHLKLLTDDSERRHLVTTFVNLKKIDPLIAIQRYGNVTVKIAELFYI